MGQHLTAVDYLTRDQLELQSHPDYSDEAMRIMDRIRGMNTEEIENMLILQRRIND